MLFNTYQFLLFLIIVYLLFCLIPKVKWVILLSASYYFYMAWKWEYIILIIVSTLVDFFCAKKISLETNQHRKKVFLFISLGVNLSILFFFKYYEFFIRDVLLLPESSALASFDVLLPVGISFYTFQTMSYTLDVYNNKVKVEMHLGRFALFVTYFPQLVAGPIERASHIIHQLKENLTFKSSNLIPAAKLFVFGLFKKIVIADRVALIVDPIYESPGDFSSFTLIFASIMFAIQIYCDFSGYSDMAIGLSKAFNVDLMKNFNSPYFSKSISEFWGRWHISLSTWFRDYVYIPMGGNRTIKWRWYYNLIITFLLSGIWHGANWTFVVWGGFHGLLLIFEKNFPKMVIHRSIRVVITFTLVLIGWVFFRANNISDAFQIFQSVFTTSLNVSRLQQELLLIGLSKLNLIVAVSAIFVLFLKDLKLNIHSQMINWGYYYLLIYSIIIFGIGETKSFIYFQF